MDKQQGWPIVVAICVSVLLGPPVGAQAPATSTEEEPRPEFTAEELRVRMITFEQYKILVWVDRRRPTLERLDIDALTLENLERAIVANAALWRRARAVAAEAQRVGELADDNLNVLSREQDMREGIAELDELRVTAREVAAEGDAEGNVRRTMAGVARRIASNRESAMRQMFFNEQALEREDR